MDNRFYESKLINHKIFKDLNENPKDNPSGKLRNLIDLRDDVLYVWNSSENCLFSLNLKRLEENDDETPYQKLHFLTPPAYPVERVITSACGSRICVWGSRGVTIAELPSRWGRGGLFDSGSPTVLCKSHSLDERFLYAQCEVRRVQWHPSSLSHLLVLVSDNTMRLYNIALKSGPKVVKTISIGPKPSSLLSGKTILDSLGDTAVDFTATPDGEHLLILRGNGDVYMLQCDLDAKIGVITKLSGPLSMYPPADDNYGTDSCAVLCVGNSDTPPMLVVASCSAMLHHCLLLPAPEESDGYALYVVETVELNIALNPDIADMKYSYPVHLYPCSNNTYACVHAGGVHTVTMPILGNLKEYAMAEEGAEESHISSVYSRSLPRHLVMSRVPPRGAALTAPPLPALLLLPGEGAPLMRTLEPYDLEEHLYKELQLKNPALDQEDINKILKERQKLSFTAIIQEILKREASQPILQVSDKTEPSPKECLEFATQATLKLRGEYIWRQQNALEAIARKVNALRTLSKQHTSWISDLQKEIEDLKLQTSVLKDKCYLAEKHQDDLKYRCSAVVRRARGSCCASSAERALLAELERQRAGADAARDQLETVRRHAAERADQMMKWNEEYKKKDIALGKSHSDTIQSVLQQQTKQISTLIEETKLLKDQLSIV